MAGQAVVTIGDKQWQAYLAASYAELVSGLSGWSSLPPGGGMLFLLSQEQAVSVTTFGMLFPIDIIFLSSHLQVTGVARGVAPDMLVTGNAPARYFLEVNSGEAEGIEIGDAVNIALSQATGTGISTDWISPVVSLAGAVMVGAFMANMGKVMAGAVFARPEQRPELYGPRGERLLQTLPAKDKLYQRGADGYPVGADRAMREAWGPIPDPDQPFWSKDGFVKPARIYGWQFSPDYNRWRAYVRFPDGTETWTSPSKQDAAKRPTRRDVSIGTWTERDRLGIWLTDKRTGNTIAEWWDEDAGEMFEQGFFKPGMIRQQAITGRDFEESVMAYAESVGILTPTILPAVKPSSSGDTPVVDLVDKWSKAKRNSTLALKDLEAVSQRYDITDCKEALLEYRDIDRSDYSDSEEYQEARNEAWEAFIECLESLSGEEEAELEEKDERDTSGKAQAVIPEQPRKQGTKGELEFLPDSPEFLAYTIDDIGYRDRLDSAFQAAIARAKKGARP